MTELKRPTLLLNKEICLRNIRNMKAKADKHGLIFRPHFKTHQSAEIGEWFRDEGVDRIAVSSVSMARYFAAHGWKDITIAFPLNIAETPEINELAATVNLNLVIENMESMKALARTQKHLLGVFIKLDAGYHRTGIPVEDHERIKILVHEIGHARHLTFEGFLVHNGHTYHQPGPDDILEIHRQSREKLAALKQKLFQHDIKSFVSLGDTPAVSLAGSFEEISEIRPGNFVFYDVMQHNLGVCTENDIAVAVACPVVSKHPDRMEIVLYGGAVHLSKDFIKDRNGHTSFGLVAPLNENGWEAVWPDTYVKSLSQEHGIIKTIPGIMRRVEIGDFVAVLPVHSCLTTNLMREMYTLEGERITTMLT
ncbi:MAG: alanine racemase [Bacteroidales bacterium]